MEDAKSVWNSKQYIFKILNPFWIYDCRRSYCFVQRKGRIPKIHAQETQKFWHQNLQTMWWEWTHIWYESLIVLFDWGEEILYRDSRFILVNDVLETMAQVDRHEQHSTEFGLSRSATVTKPKCPVWTASGGKRNVFSEEWRKCDVCVLRCFWHYHAKAQLHNFWGWNFLCKIGAQNRTASKIN